MRSKLQSTDWNQFSKVILSSFLSIPHISSQFLVIEKSVKFPKFASYQLFPYDNSPPSAVSKLYCTIKDRCQRIRMWIEQCFIVGDIAKWIKDDTIIARFVSVVDEKDLIICFAEKESLVFFVLREI